MQPSRAHEEFVSFMVDYTAFLGQMKQDESEKMAALLSKELPRIEQSIAQSQANAKQLENFETKRLMLQAQAGYEGLSFRQLIEKAPPRQRDKLWQLFSRFEGNVAEIRFSNDKSMAIARDNMIEIDPAAVLPGLQGARPSNPYERLREEQSESSKKIMETKA